MHKLLIIRLVVLLHR